MNPLWVKFLIALENTFNATCRDAIPLISAERDRSLTLSERLRLRGHLAICAVCRFYSGQIHLVCKMVKKIGAGEFAGEDGEMSTTRKASLKKLLKT